MVFAQTDRSIIDQIITFQALLYGGFANISTWASVLFGDTKSCVQYIRGTYTVDWFAMSSC